MKQFDLPQNNPNYIVTFIPLSKLSNKILDNNGNKTTFAEFHLNKMKTDVSLIYFGKVVEIPMELRNDLVEYSIINTTNEIGVKMYKTYSNISHEFGKYPFNTSLQSVKTLSNYPYCVIYKI